MRKSSLVWKISLSTTVALLLLLVVAGHFVQAQIETALERNLDTELQGSFKAYESLWSARTEMLRSVSMVLSTMSDVRAAFQTNDRATIQDTVAEMWKRISLSDALFFVTDGKGDVIAGAGGMSSVRTLKVVGDAFPRFPAQSTGFATQEGRLYEFVVTPVYVQAGGTLGLLNVLVTGFPVEDALAKDLKSRTGGSDFVFLEGGRPVATTLTAGDTARIGLQYRRGAGLRHLDLGDREYPVLGTALQDLSGATAGDLLVVHNFDVIRRDLDSLRLKLLLTWMIATFACLAISLYLARRTLKPIQELDQAAAHVTEQKYEARVSEGGDDELGRLARTFNAMCRSIQDAREELIRHERISTIGRLSSSIVHDLRNPLASIYGGAEMMMDGDLSPAQMQRIAGNIYRSSRTIKDMLQQLVDVSRGRIQTPEPCRLSEVIGAAAETQTPNADQQGVEIIVDIDHAIETPVEPGRMERVFANLIGNSIDAMHGGGVIRISAVVEPGHVVIHVDDNGPGIPPAVRQRLFQPFATSGKNGLGLGLALSRQTVLDHGGDLWVDDEAGQGAHFRLRLPYSATAPVATASTTVAT
ncbi:MAG TPA: ATP-binding protein [Bryobacteraceae bacterium]|nr:ATP-binding protein [Bryobacteraceae bacterium]